MSSAAADLPRSGMLPDRCLKAYDAAMDRVLELAKRNRADSRDARARLLELQADALRLATEASRLDELIYRERCGLAGCVHCNPPVVKVAP